MAQNDPVVNRIRIIPRKDDFLDRNVGASGEIFYSKDVNTLRLYSGNDRGGFEVVTETNLRRNIASQELATIKYSVTVDNQADSANRYVLNGDYHPAPKFTRGYTYVFDQSDQTNLYYPNAEGTTLNPHPLLFSITANGIHATPTAGVPYETGVIYLLEDLPVTRERYIQKFTASTSRKVQITITATTPNTLYYYCQYHANMGNTITISYPGTGSYNDLTDKPTIPADLGDLTDTGSLLFDGSYGSLTGTPTIPSTILDLGITDGNVNQVLRTDGAGNFTFVDQTGGSGSGDTFKTIVSDDGQTIASGEDTLNVLGGTNIATAIATDTSNVTINLSAFSVDFLSDVDTTTVAPTTGQVLKWNGTKWAPGVDATTGGAGTDADTLDGFDGSYYLDYGNFTNTPTVATLSSFSVGNELVASGNGAISYDNTTGVFRYTPPTAAGLGAITAETNDLTSAVVWASVPNEYITQSSVLQHQSALSITSDQITDRSDEIVFVGDDSTGSSVPVGSTIQFQGSGGASVQVSNGVVTIAASGGGGTSNSFSTIAADGNNIVAASATDTLILTPGSNVTFGVDTGAKQITINSNATSGASDFDDLQDVTTAGLKIDLVAEQAIVRLDVSADGLNGYRFLSHYTTLNPTIYAISGTTIAFNLNSGTMGSHPFQIQDNTGTQYDTGLVHYTPSGVKTTGSNAQDKTSGTLYWHVPFGISGNWRYQCTSHTAMVGTITVKAFNAL
tara:strand:- start:3794 stop:5992 length:2199 start_codon:yes stop_codon:yes gene_type:complete